MRYEIIPIHRHDHARSTPTALTTILLGYFLLCGVETVTFITDSFCGGYLPTITTVHWAQTLQSGTNKGFNTACFRRDSK